MNDYVETQEKLVPRYTKSEFEWAVGEPHFGSSKRLGFIENAREVFERDRRRVWDRLGHMRGFTMTGNRVLVAIWVTDYQRTGSIILPDKAADEDKWQGKSGMVVAMGPHAFVSDEHRTFLPQEMPKLGDWVMYRRGDGPMLQVWGHECIMLDDTSIRAILDRPDAVY